MTTRKTILLVLALLLLVFLLLTLSAFRPSVRFADARALDVYIGNRLVYSLIPVEGGTFMMGATSEQGSSAYGDEKPAHRVTVDNFWMGEFEVTQGLWYDVMGGNPSYFQGDKTAFGSQWRNLPVENVSWDDCQEFIRKLNARRSEMNLGDYSSWKFRLPTEAEWEYAARGGKDSRGYKYSGSNTLGNVAWYRGNSIDGINGLTVGSGNYHQQTHPVGTKQSNELGLYDMSGNVWEWCQDWYGSNYYTSSLQHNPCNNMISASFRVLRGGSWDVEARSSRVAYRFCYYSDYRDYNYGLRLVLAPEIVSYSEPTESSSSFSNRTYHGDADGTVAPAGTNVHSRNRNLNDSRGIIAGSFTSTGVQAARQSDVEVYSGSGLTVMAQFPGGEAGLISFMNKTVVYPRIAVEQDLQGTVYLRFVVEKDGSIGEVHVTKSLSKECDAAAIIALNKVPRFSPAKNERGEPVRVWFNFPVSFRIN